MATAFTINSTTIGHKAEVGGKTPWLVIGYSEDVYGTAQTLRAAPPTGKQYLERIDVVAIPELGTREILIYDDDDAYVAKVRTIGEWGHRFEDPLEFSGAIKIAAMTTDPVHVIAEGFDV